MSNEKLLVERIAQAYWRLERCYSVERAFFENRIEASDMGDPDAALANLFLDKVEAGRMRLLMRYLASNERAYYKALADLNKAQAGRRKQEREQAVMEAYEQIQNRPARPSTGFVSQPGEIGDQDDARRGLEYGAVPLSTQGTAHMAAVA
jgi:hypothetical protein